MVTELWNQVKIVIVVELVGVGAIVAAIQLLANLGQMQFVILAMRTVVHRLASSHPVVQYAVLVRVSAIHKKSVAELLLLVL